MYIFFQRGFPLASEEELDRSLSVFFFLSEVLSHGLSLFSSAVLLFRFLSILGLEKAEDFDNRDAFTFFQVPPLARDSNPVSATSASPPSLLITL